MITPRINNAGIMFLEKGWFLSKLKFSILSSGRKTMILNMHERSALNNIYQHGHFVVNRWAESRNHLKNPCGRYN